MIVDVIILTKSDNGRNSNITERTLQSLHDSEIQYVFKPIVMESGELCDQYTRLIDKYIVPKERFNYNRFLNIAMEHTSSEWVVISNNDLGYEKGWFTEMMNVHQLRPDIESFSPKDPMLYMLYFDWHFLNSPDIYFESYSVSEAVMGWCIVLKRTAIDKVFPLDEQFDMYYQDNDYAKTIESLGIKHALVRHSIVVHHGTMRVKDISHSDKMQEDELKFRNKWK